MSVINFLTVNCGALISTFSCPLRVVVHSAMQAFNYISNKGYSRMSREDEKHWVDLMNVIHDSVKGGMKYNTGTLLMVLSRPVSDAQMVAAEKTEKPPKKQMTPSKHETPKVLNP